MTSEERAVIKAAERLIARDCAERKADLQVAVQRLKISRQPEHTVEVIPCMKYSPNSASMFCILPEGHDADEIAQHRVEYPWWDDNVPSIHFGYPGGVRGTGPNGGARGFTYWPARDTMEGHERPACSRFPSCERHP